MASSTRINLSIVWLDYPTGTGETT